MSILDWSDAAEITGGVWHGRPAAGALPEFAHDSRILEPGQAFVALAGRRDGHDFVAGAAAAGAGAALVTRPVDAPLCQLVVPDALRALGQLARQARYRSGCTVAAVTGSAGKTTVCGMIAAIMTAAFGGRAVLASRGNFNNHIGLPLSLLRLDPAHRYAVLEAGMSAPGELSDLAAIAEPDLGVITNIGSAHLGNFSSRSQIAQAKSELLAGTRRSGGCVFGFADEFSDLFAGRAGGRRIFGFAATAVAGSSGWLADGEDFAIELADGSRISASLQVQGAHNRINALCAAVSCIALGVEREAIESGLASFAGIPGRLSVRRMRGGGVLIDDTYNASPESTRAALAVLADRPERRKVLILGDLLELGEDSEQLHRQLGEEARSRGIDQVLACGQLAAAAADRQYPGQEELVDAACKLAGDDTVILVKGSRGSRMERVVRGLAETGGGR